MNECRHSQEYLLCVAVGQLEPDRLRCFQAADQAGQEQGGVCHAGQIVRLWVFNFLIQDKCDFLLNNEISRSDNLLQFLSVIASV